LGRQEHDDQVPAGEEPDQAQAEQDGPDGQVVGDGNHARTSRRVPAIAIAPTVATRSNVPTISTARRGSLTRVRPRASTLAAGSRRGPPPIGVTTPFGESVTSSTSGDPVRIVLRRIRPSEMVWQLP